uniref:Uncharacterized protein n=1 Tax=Anguilla anguilla TaxID=7936 RepID=A0A0E9T0E3_ANGAN
MGHVHLCDLFYVFKLLYINVVVSKPASKECFILSLLIELFELVG